MKKTLLFITLIFNLLVCYSSFAKNIDEEFESIDNSIIIDRITTEDIEVKLPSMIFTFKETPITIKFKNPTHTRLLLNENKIHFIINGEDKELTFIDGISTFNHSFSENKTLTIYTEEFSYSNNVTAYPLWVLLTPILLIIGWLVLRKMGKKN